jgi:hypothetical protein
MVNTCKCYPHTNDNTDINSHPHGDRNPNTNSDSDSHEHSNGVSYHHSICNALVYVNTLAYCDPLSDADTHSD